MKLPFGGRNRINARQYHIYGRELVADGFVSQLVLPADRLKELKGDRPVPILAGELGIPEEELRFLLENECAEPTTKQLFAISRRAGCSIMWLMGYHVPRSPVPGNGDAEIISAVGRRNAAEATKAKAAGKGLLRALASDQIARRIQRTNIEIAAVAARAVARLHYPLDDEDVMRLRGQPVYVEMAEQADEFWALSAGCCIVTADGEMSLEGNGSAYLMYQTPKLM